MARKRAVDDLVVIYHPNHPDGYVAGTDEPFKVTRAIYEDAWKPKGWRIRGSA